MNPWNILVALGVGFATAELGLLATTVYLHRGLAHRALTMHPVAAFPIRVLLWLATGIRPREWTGVHRLHHAALDEPNDPHSPAQVGFWRVQLMNIVMYHRAAKNREVVEKYTRDLPHGRLDQWVFDRETIGPLLGLGLLCLVFGWQIGVMAALFHLVFYVGFNGSVNAVGHTRGRRPQANSATNGQLLALLTWGEGMHNNHHAVPTAARFSFRRAEIDPAWYFIRGLGGMQLLKVRHQGGLIRSNV
jgi:stearoyl-CoA desaturase (delta-9 desaturase)